MFQCSCSNPQHSLCATCRAEGRLLGAAIDRPRTPRSSTKLSPAIEERRLSCSNWSMRAWQVECPLFVSFVSIVLAHHPTPNALNTASTGSA